MVLLNPWVLVIGPNDPEHHKHMRTIQSLLSYPAASVIHGFETTRLVITVRGSLLLSSPRVQRCKNSLKEECSLDVEASSAIKLLLHLTPTTNSLQVPELWARAAYPSLKPLGSWVADYHARVAFMRSWLTKGPPSCFWLPGDQEVIWGDQKGGVTGTWMGTNRGRSFISVFGG